MDAGIGVNQHSFGSKALGTGAGDGVAVAEVAVLDSIEVDRPVIFLAALSLAYVGRGVAGKNYIAPPNPTHQGFDPRYADPASSFSKHSVGSHPI